MERHTSTKLLRAAFTCSEILGYAQNCSKLLQVVETVLNSFRMVGDSQNCSELLEQLGTGRQFGSAIIR